MIELLRYLPGVNTEGFASDYVGVRPKLVGPGGGFQDFVFETSGTEMSAPLVSLMGIESPGLTASLAVAEKVVEELVEGGLVDTAEKYRGDAFIES